MSSPEPDVANVLRDLLDAYAWSVTKPGTIRLQTEDEDGNPTKGVNAGVEEYILIAETGTRTPGDFNPTRATVNYSNQASFEFATADSRARREEVYKELEQIGLDARDRREASSNGLDIGGWDTLTFSMTAPDEEIFNYWVIEGTVEFGAKSRSPGYP